MALTKATNEFIQNAIDVLQSQGRDVTTAGVLAWLNGEGITAKASDVHDSAPWKALVAKEKGQAAPPATDKPKMEKPKAAPAAAQSAKTKSASKTTNKTPTKTQETPMPKTAKKPHFPSKPCPKCGKLIHARSHSHPDCGWVMKDAAPAPAAATHTGAKKKVGRPKKVHAMAGGAGGITVEDIQAIKHLVDQIGAEKVADLAKIFG